MSIPAATTSSLYNLHNPGVYHAGRLQALPDERDSLTGLQRNDACISGRGYNRLRPGKRPWNPDNDLKIWRREMIAYYKESGLGFIMWSPGNKGLPEFWFSPLKDVREFADACGWTARRAG